MKPRLISILVANLFVASPLALAADGGLVVSGSVGVGYRAVKDTATDPSKLNEYRDLSSSPIGIFDVRGRGDTYYFNAFGENIGRDDQYIDLRGGQYGVFKYQLYDNELRHNFGSGLGARSPYSGIGGSTLTATFPSLNPNTWNTFDNSYYRQDVGGMFEFSNNSPWYIRADANQVRRSGVKVIAGAQGTSPGNGFVDLPSPVDFTAQNFSLEGGYSSKRGHFAANVMHSRFSNGNDLLRWTNGFFANGLDTTVLPPDNDLWKLGLNGNLRQLPMNSTLAGRVTYSKVTDNVSILQNMLSTGGTNPATVPNSPVYNGEVVNKTASASLTSHPSRELDTRLYWNWSRKENNSTQMVFSPAVGTGLLSGGAGTNCATNGATAVPCVPELFNYRKNNLGIDVGYRINAQNKVSAGFDYFDTDRERIDFTKTIDRKYYAEYKNSSLEMVDARIKYQYLQRRSNFEGGDESNPIDAFVRRFDLANVNQNLVKLVLDISPPVRFLDFGLEAIYKNNNYKDTILGRTGDTRQEYYASVSYGDPKAFRVMLFGDVELTQLDSAHRVGTGNPNPFAPPSGTPSSTYTWTAENNDRAWQVGLGADWLPMERLKLNGSLIWARTRGTTDFAAQAGTNLAAPLLPIPNFDNTYRTTLNLKGTYKLDKQWDLTGGYAFERYRYSDIGFDGFTYVVGTGTGASYLSGQSAFQNYTANILYLIATYKF